MLLQQKMENLESREKAFLKTINTGGVNIKNLTSDSNFYSLIFFTQNFFIFSNSGNRTLE